MTSLDIKINSSILLYYSSSLINTIDDETLLLIIKSFVHYLKHLYADKIEVSMYSPRYKGEWEPKNDPGYKEYIGTDPTEDIMILIRESLEIDKVGDNFILKFNPYYKYPGSDKSLLTVLRAIEHGTSDFPARPIIGRCRRYILTNLRALWRGYLSLKGVI